jgi:hypothetical protein
MKRFYKTATREPIHERGQLPCASVYKSYFQFYTPHVLAKLRENEIHQKFYGKTWGINFD